VAAGTTIVEQYNSGSDPHNLILQRQGTVAFSFPTLDPGGDQRQTVNLTPGTWTLYCSLLDHKALGMQATLTVN
jgi:plastocyanin